MKLYGLYWTAYDGVERLADLDFDPAAIERRTRVWPYEVREVTEPVWAVRFNSNYREGHLTRVAHEDEILDSSVYCGDDYTLIAPEDLDPAEAVAYFADLRADFAAEAAVESRS